jgi:hypothetical protein
LNPLNLNSSRLRNVQAHMNQDSVRAGDATQSTMRTTMYNSTQKWHNISVLGGPSYMSDLLEANALPRAIGRVGIKQETFSPKDT